MAMNLTINYHAADSNDCNKWNYDNTNDSSKKFLINERHDVYNYRQGPCKSCGNQYTSFGDCLNVNIGTHDSDVPIHCY